MPTFHNEQDHPPVAMAPKVKEDAKTRAEALKARGNERYRAEELGDAIKLYKEAAALQPEAPVRLPVFTYIQA